MELTTIERIILPSILKKEGNFKVLIINEDIEKKVKLTQEELIDFDIVINDKGLTMNNKGSESVKVIDFSDLELDEIKSIFKSLDNSNKLNKTFISLYKKVMIN